MRLSRVFGVVSLFVAGALVVACSDRLATTTHEGDVSDAPSSVADDDETVVVDPEAIQATFTKDMEVLTASYQPDESTYAVLALNAKARDTLFLTADAADSARTPLMWLVYAPSDVVTHEAQRGSEYHRATLSKKLNKSGTYYVVLRERDRIATNFEVTLRRIPAVPEEDSTEPTPPPEENADAGAVVDAGGDPVSFDSGVKCAAKSASWEYVSAGTRGCACSYTGKYQYCVGGWCDSSTDVTGICKAPSALGEACSSYSSSGSPFCASGLICDLKAGTVAGTCVSAPTKEGDYCSSSARCPSAYTCEWNDAGSSGSCAPKRKAGEACTSYSDCASGNCETFNGVSVCVESKSGVIGSTGCQRPVAGVRSTCPTNAYCETATGADGVCTATCNPETYLPCADDKGVRTGACVPTSTSAGVKNLCASPTLNAAVGTTGCARASDGKYVRCAEQLYCDASKNVAGVCAATAGLGVACTSSTDCSAYRDPGSSYYTLTCAAKTDGTKVCSSNYASGIASCGAMVNGGTVSKCSTYRPKCVTDVDSNGICEGALSDGASCTSNDACASGVCNERKTCGALKLAGSYCSADTVCALSAPYCLAGYCAECEDVAGSTKTCPTESKPVCYKNACYVK